MPSGCTIPALTRTVSRIYGFCSPPRGSPWWIAPPTSGVREVNVITVYIDLQPIPFNKGFYSVDMTFFFDVCLDLFGGTASCPVPINGVAIFNKKVVLYGSEGNVKLFTSGCSIDDVQAEDARVLPKATVQVAQPVALSARLCEHSACGCEPYCRIPESICQRYGGDFDSCPQKNTVYVTIGLFIIVQMVRNVQMLIPAYDFCVPEKECVASSDNPCELFRRIDFPTSEFSRRSPQTWVGPVNDSRRQAKRGGAS